MKSLSKVLSCKKIIDTITFPTTLTYENLSTFTISLSFSINCCAWHCLLVYTSRSTIFLLNFDSLITQANHKNEEISHDSNIMPIVTTICFINPLCAPPPKKKKRRKRTSFENYEVECISKKYENS